MSNIDEIQEFVEGVDGMVMDDSGLSAGEVYVKFTHSDSNIQMELKKGLFDRIEGMDGVSLDSEWDSLVDRDLWRIRVR